MRRSLVLFDVDGTILVTGGAGFRGMARAAEALYGRALDWDGIEPGGRLDPFLFRLAAERSGIEPGPSDLDRFRDRYLEFLPEELNNLSHRMRVMPGVAALLRTLHLRQDVVLGLLTGNFGGAARLKLEAAGIDWSWFDVGAFGDEAPARPDLVPVAEERFAQKYGQRVARERVILVGDTPKDVECGLAHSCRVLGVATGRHSAAELLAAGATAAVENLADPSPLLAMLER